MPWVNTDYNSNSDPYKGNTSGLTGNGWKDYSTPTIGGTSGIKNPWPDAGTNPGVWENDDAINSYYTNAFNPYADRQLQQQTNQANLAYNYANLNQQGQQQTWNNNMADR